MQPAVCTMRSARREMLLASAQQKTCGGITPDDWRSFGEYSLLEDSCYTSQEGRQICSLNLPQVR